MSVPEGVGGGNGIRRGAVVGGEEAEDEIVDEIGGGGIIHFAGVDEIRWVLGFLGFGDFRMFLLLFGCGPFFSFFIWARKWNLFEKLGFWPARVR